MIPYMRANLRRKRRRWRAPTPSSRQSRDRPRPRRARPSSPTRRSTRFPIRWTWPRSTTPPIARRGRWPSRTCSTRASSPQQGRAVPARRVSRPPASTGRSWSPATDRCARTLEAEARERGIDCASSAGFGATDAGVDAARGDPGVSLVRSRIAQPRADRGRGARPPIAAMDTGGTRDIVHTGVTGLLSHDPTDSRATCAACDRRAAARARSARRARTRRHATFLGASVVERVEQVYRSLLPRAA